MFSPCEMPIRIFPISLHNYLFLIDFSSLYHVSTNPLLVCNEDTGN